AQGGRAGVLVASGGGLGLVPGPAVHARVPRQEIAHPLGHRRQGGGRGGGVERDTGPLGPVGAPHGDVVADQGNRRPGPGPGNGGWGRGEWPGAGHVKMIWPPAALSSNSPTAMMSWTGSMPSARAPLAMISPG